jgi:hypothetical protein
VWEKSGLDLRIVRPYCEKLWDEHQKESVATKTLPVKSTDGYAPIPNQMNIHLSNVLRLLSKASPLEAETIINKNDMFDGKVKSQLRRMYHDGSLITNPIDNLVESIIEFAKSDTATETKNNSPKTATDLELKIQMAIKHTILDHYFKNVKELQENVMEIAKENGIEITENELHKIPAMVS